uniref:Fibrinogen C-terminal domain-containing protein n=1 Tax=Macrostomum lignano TaxID=282301 RepID=A0A1I8FDB6_9PLAT
GLGRVRDPAAVQGSSPLFCLLPQSQEPVLSKSTMAESDDRFAAYWLRMLPEMMHVHRLFLLMRHDGQLSQLRHLNLRNPRGKYSAAAVSPGPVAHLRSARKFNREDDLDEARPESFYMTIALQSLPARTAIFLGVPEREAALPNLIVTLAFLAHVSSTIRQTVLQELRERLAYLYFPSRIAESKHKTPSGAPRPAAVAPSVPTQAARHRLRHRRRQRQVAVTGEPKAKTPCCYAVAKPLDRFLIQFEPKSSPGSCTFADSSGMSSGPRRAAGRRQQSPLASCRLATNLLHIFNCLVALRLQQGFHFAYANAGFVNLFRRVALQPSETAATAAIGDGNEGSGDVELCVQYLLYPLISRRRLDSESSEATVLEGIQQRAAASGRRRIFINQHQQPAGNRQLLDLRIVTEVWAEPQPGRPLPSDLARETTDWPLTPTSNLLPGLLRDSDERVFCVFLTLDAALKSVASAATTRLQRWRLPFAGMSAAAAARERRWQRRRLNLAPGHQRQSPAAVDKSRPDQPAHPQLEQELTTRRFLSAAAHLLRRGELYPTPGGQGGAGMESLVQPDQLQLLAQQQGWCCSSGPAAQGWWLLMRCVVFSAVCACSALLICSVLTAAAVTADSSWKLQRGDLAEYRVLTVKLAASDVHCMTAAENADAVRFDAAAGSCTLLACRSGPGGRLQEVPAPGQLQPASAMREPVNCWTTFQHRVDGSVSFNRGWSEYVSGFGQGESLNYWMGLEQLHQLTATGVWRVRWEFSDWNGTWYWVENAPFSVGPAADKYRCSMGPPVSNRSNIGQRDH